MEAILRSPFSPPLTDGKTIETEWGPFRLNPPKMIVPLSLTVTEEKKFPKGVVTFPAILDTGFNRTIEIDERHLKWPIFFEEWIVEIGQRNYLRDRQNRTRLYYQVQANIWLHRLPYAFSRNRPEKSPVLLERTTMIRVMAPETDKPWPPLPLLGLEALVANRLKLSVDGRKLQFSLER